MTMMTAMHSMNEVIVMVMMNQANGMTMMNVINRNPSRMNVQVSL